MNDDLTLLASAYLDGEATPDERARVEADPALLGEVERLRAVRITLLDASWFERPGDAAREAAIEAALGAWDGAGSDLPQSGTETPAAARSSHVRTFERRRRPSTRWLSAAAALVAVAGLGVVVSRFDGESDDDTSSVAIEAPADTAADGDALFDTSEEQTEQTASSGNAERTASADDAASESGGAEPSSGAVEQAPSAAPAATVAPEETALVADAALQVILSSPAELGSFAAEAKQASVDGADNAVTVSCVGDELEGIEYLAIGTYRDRAVVIAIVVERERALAIDPDTCEIVAEAPLP